MKMSDCFHCLTLFQMKKWLAAVLILFVLMALLISSNLFHGHASLVSYQRKTHGSMPFNLFFFPSSSSSSSSSDTSHVDHDTFLSRSDSFAEKEASQATKWIHWVLSQMKIPHTSPSPSNTSSSSSPLSLEVEDRPSSILSVWKSMIPVLSRPDCFPKAKQAMKDAENYWRGFVEEQRLQRRAGKRGKGHDHEQAHNDDGNATRMDSTTATKKKCPSSVRSELKQSGGRSNGVIEELEIPCGLVVDSSITIVGIAGDGDGSFAVELVGDHHDNEQASIILHFNVTLEGQHRQHGWEIRQNTWTREDGWGADEQRCPSDISHSTTVDDLEPCDDHGHENAELASRVMRNSSADTKSWLPFIKGSPFVATLWVGWEGLHMTVHGKHITAFAYRQNLNPSLVNNVRLKGNVKPISILSTNLPTLEDIADVGLEFLEAPRLLPKRRTKLFIGVFSTANNFDRRMAVRRSWMQYETVRSGDVTVRFFVGQHSNKHVNDEIWREASRYGDMQLMPFLDYYDLITLKTIAICIFGIEKMQPDFIMKTDDDTFVRIDEVLRGLKDTKKSKGLLYGRIEFNSHPRRDPKDKWYIGTNEWHDSSYPPWAMGPGYIISEDIARFIANTHYKRTLKLFKLEDVSMGIWIQEYKKQNHSVYYVNDDKYKNLGCSEGYVIAHYQKPKQMACLWRKLQEGFGPICCEDR